MILFWSNEIIDGLVKLAFQDARAKHIINILHKTAGDVLSAGVVNKSAGVATIKSISKECIILEYSVLSKSLQASSEECTKNTQCFSNILSKRIPIKLYLGAVRPVQIRRIVRDIVALGVSELHIVTCDLCEKSYLQADVYKNVNMEKLLFDAAMQAATPFLPKYFTHKSLDEAVKDLETGKSFKNVASNDIIDNLVLDETSETIKGACNDSLFVSNGNLKNATKNTAINSDTIVKIALDNVTPTISLSEALKLLPGNATSILLAVGCERGWVAREREVLCDNGFTMARIGGRIMRSETAVTVALAITQSTLGAL